MNFLAQQILWGAVLPALIALAVLVVFNWRLGRGAGVSLHWGTPVALTAGYLFAHWRIVGLPLSFPPLDSNEWLFVMGVVVTLWAIVEHFTARWERARAAARLVLAGAVAWLVLKPLIGSVWQGSAWYFWWGGLTLGWWLWWSLQAGLADRLPGPVVPLVLSMVAGGGGLILLWSNSSSLSQLGGAVAAVVGALVPLMLWRRDVLVGASAIAPAVGLLGLVWINAIAFVPVPAWRIAVLAIASLTPLLALLPAFKRRSLWLSVAVSAVVTAIVLGALMLPTYRAYVASAQTYGY
ncbi:MAG: hypothetical protein HPY54_11705 [Chthonomonadetes bacterium]|nr:hypothetical protein [Chthonomonadetes bacterium]